MRIYIPWLFLLFAVVCNIVVAGPKPAAGRVIVMKYDGGSVVGEIVEATPAGVSVRTRPGADPVAIAWFDIKRINNGLTRRAVLAEYQEKHPEQLCGDCKGAGGAKCDHCEGSGIEPSTATVCETCDGKGMLGNCPRGVDGYMPCPGPCLKKESFSGAKDVEGKRWKVFKGKTGSLRISDGHIGEVVVMEKGDPVLQGKCTVCGGEARVTCNQCLGTGRKFCGTCDGIGKKGPACAQCEHGVKRCQTCFGTGMKVTSGR
jgi:hypothetical protein